MSARPKKAQPAHTKPAPAPLPPKRGPGRPRKPTAPRTEQQAALAEAINAAEKERDAAALAYSADPTVAAELRLLRAELSVTSAWSSYTRAQGNHSSSIKYSELTTKLAGRIAALREIEGIDKLTALEERSRREDALGKGART